MTKPLLLLILGVLLLGYSYACFFKKNWVHWLSVAPILEERSPFTPFMLAAHGIISAIMGFLLILQFCRRA